MQSIVDQDIHRQESVERNVNQQRADVADESEQERNTTASFLQGTRKRCIPKSEYDTIQSPTGTSLSQLILEEVNDLIRETTHSTNAPMKISHNVRIPVHPLRRRRQQRIAIVVQPYPCPATLGTSAPPALRAKGKTAFKFKRLAPGLTESNSLITSTILGSVSGYVEGTNVELKAETRPAELVDDLGQNMRKVRAILKLREERILLRRGRRPLDRSASCLKHFDREMQERHLLTGRLAQQVGRRVSELMLNSNKGVRRKREMKELGDTNQGPWPLYEIHAVDKVAPVDPEQFFKEPPYNHVTFTGKAGLMKLKTAAAGFETPPKERVQVEEYFMLKKGLKAFHKDRQVGQEEKQALPGGLRDPDFNELIVIGTNNTKTQHKSPLDRNDCIGRLEYLSKKDLQDDSTATSGRNPFDLINEFPDNTAPAKLIDASCHPILHIEPTDPAAVSLTRREYGLDVFIKLYCPSQGPPATTQVTLKNVGQEPLEFGLYPIEYGNPLWSGQKSGLIYFMESTGVLEPGQSHSLTAFFESNAEGTFAESYRLWTIPHTTTPRDIRVVVEGRSEPNSYVQLPTSHFDPEVLKVDSFLPSSPDQLKFHVIGLLENMTLRKGPCSRIPVEEQFQMLNNLEFQSEGVTKLKHTWLFAHLLYSDIPWYDTLIDREREKKAELPGEMNKRLLEDLADAQVKLNHTETTKPAYVDLKIPTEKAGVYWRNPAIVYKCPVHDQDLPLPGE